MKNTTNDTDVVRGLERKPHWTKKIFTQHDIKICDVANALDLSYPYVSGMLSGTMRVTDEQEKRLGELAERVKKAQNGKEKEGQDGKK